MFSESYSGSLIKTKPFSAHHGEYTAAILCMWKHTFPYLYWMNIVTTRDALFNIANISLPIKPRGATSFVLDNQSYLIVFAFKAAAVALILRHIPFKSPGQAFIAQAYQVDNGLCLNNLTISYQGWHPYKDLPLTASAQEEGLNNTSFIYAWSSALILRVRP